MEYFTDPSQLSAIQLTVLALSATVTVNVVWRFIRGRSNSKGHPLPPGPSPLPFLGNVPFIDVKQPWSTYTAWQKKYGDIIHVRLLDDDMIILNSYSDALELLDKRSKIYSDRPFLATLEPYGHADNITFARYGAYWRSARRIIHQTFRAEAALAFRPMQLRRARQVVINIIDDPNAYKSHYKTYSAALAMSAVYDYEPKVRGDPIIAQIKGFLETSLMKLGPEMAVPLRAFPFLMSVPKWIPGLSRIRREASNAQALGIKAFEAPYKMVQKRIAAKEDVVPNTMVFNHIQHMENLDDSQRVEYEKALKSASMTAVIGAADTTIITLVTFTLAMIKNPRIWKRAQAEIDTVIGMGRLPEFEDRPSLPYVEAIVRESSRWIPVAPLGVPHAVITDDIYKGYHIPRGATIVSNIWAMARDEVRYPNPDIFMPERFLNSDGTLTEDDPADFVFGFGRRICPGKHAADASLWGGIATLLATLEFHPTKSEYGNDAVSRRRTHDSLNFPCNLVPRAHITKEVLQRSLAK